MVLGIVVLTSMVDRLQQSFEQLRALGARLQMVREEERRRKSPAKSMMTSVRF
jgi:hypothetical protein